MRLSDKVGIKISTAGGPLFTTHRDVVNAIVDGLVAAGHPRARIIVWDRELDGIKEAGYRPDAEGYQLISIVPRDGYDAKGDGHCAAAGETGLGRSRLQVPIEAKYPLAFRYAKTQATAVILPHPDRAEVTKIINVPVMSDSEMNGIAGCLYNVTIPNIDNWRRFRRFGAFGASSIAELYSRPDHRTKGRAQFDGRAGRGIRRWSGIRNRIMPCITPPFSRARIRSRSMRSRLRKIEQWRTRPSFHRSVRRPAMSKSPAS